MERGLRSQSVAPVRTSAEARTPTVHRVCSISTPRHVGVFVIALLYATISTISALDAAPPRDDTTQTPVAQGLGEKAAKPAASPNIPSKKRPLLDESKLTLKDYAASRNKTSEASGDVVPTQSTWDKVGALGAVVLVLLLCGAVILVFRRMQPTVRDREGHRVLEVLGRVPVSSKQQISMVRVGSRVIAVGISPDRMTCLSEITDANEVMRLLPASEFNATLNVESGELEIGELEPSPVLESRPADRIEPFRDELSRLRGMVAHWRHKSGRRAADGGAQ